MKTRAPFYKFFSPAVIFLSIFTAVMNSYAATPAISVSGVTTYSITWNVQFPGSGVYGNKVELWDPVAGKWSKIVQTDYATDGKYTASGLKPATDYICQISWYDSGMHIFYLQSGVTTLYAPSITPSNITDSSITWTIQFPSSGAYGNKLELTNTSTGQLTKIVDSNYAKSGTYTSTGLTPFISYICRLTYLENGTSKTYEKSARTLNTPVLSVTNVTTYSIAWKVQYPVSGVSGNKIELWNPVTSRWIKIVNSETVVDGSYTSTNLNPDTAYICRISWYDSGMHVLSIQTEASTLKAPSIMASNITDHSIKWTVQYPKSGIYGNKLELWNTATGEWTKIVESDCTTDGTYTTAGLTPATTYMCRLTWLENGSWEVKDVYAGTLNKSYVTASAVSSYSIIWKVQYPISSASGNKIELWNPVTSRWIKIVNSESVADGSYTSTNLNPDTAYTCRISWYDSGMHVLSIQTEASTLKAPSITAGNITDHSITWTVQYPKLGIYGNKLELWNTATGEWTKIVESDYTTDGTYTTAGLTPVTTYMCRLTWLENGSWEVKDVYAGTCNTPLLTASNITDTSITWNVQYPISGAGGNKIELYDLVSGQWTEIEQGNTINDGSYTSYNLTPATTYLCRSSWYDSGMHILCQQIEASTLNTASIIFTSFTDTSITWKVVYPVSGVYGNKLELWDPVAGQWTNIAQPDNVADGIYTSNNLHPDTTYIGKISWYDSGMHILSKSLAVATTYDYNFDNGLGNWIHNDAGFGTFFPYIEGQGVNGSNCIGILSIAHKEAYWKCQITLNPGRYYTFSAAIKGENISVPRINDRDYYGANICIRDNSAQFTKRYFSPPENSFGTFDWRTVTINFKASDSGIVEICCCLGFGDRGAQGLALFDDVSIKEDTSISENNSGKHIYTALDINDINRSLISSTDYNQWVEHLDMAYDAYSDLVGFKPYGGDKICIFSVDQPIRFNWRVTALSGNPILWQRGGVWEQLFDCWCHNDWSFGILHEISHDFDDSLWCWEEEFFANTKMYYVIDTINGSSVRLKANIKMPDGTTQNGEKSYTAADLIDFYEDESKWSYNTCKDPSTEFEGDALTYKFIKIQKDIGWEPFKKTFRFFIDLRKSAATDSDARLCLECLEKQSNVEKFYTFLALLNEFSVKKDFEDFKAMYFSQDELNRIEAFINSRS